MPEGYISRIRIIDYRIRIIPPTAHLRSKVRSIVTFSDGKDEWITVGVASDTFKAALEALLDGFEYALYKLINSK